ncbi:MAG: hypothetical protein KC736_01580 [Candidatus Moranbacteria bacterium]|nr:hypothetical protein [Candidatus Moranbacteria bacterium]
MSVVLWSIEFFVYTFVGGGVMSADVVYDRRPISDLGESVRRTIIDRACEWVIRHCYGGHLPSHVSVSHVFLDESYGLREYEAASRDILFVFAVFNSALYSVRVIHGFGCPWDDSSFSVKKVGASFQVSDSVNDDVPA